MDDQTKLKDEVMGRIVGSKRIRRRALCIIAAGLASIVVLYILKRSIKPFYCMTLSINISFKIQI